MRHGITNSHKFSFWLLNQSKIYRTRLNNEKNHDFLFKSIIFDLVNKNQILSRPVFYIFSDSLKPGLYKTSFILQIQH